MLNFMTTFLDLSLSSSVNLFYLGISLFSDSPSSSSLLSEESTISLSKLFSYPTDHYFQFLYFLPSSSVKFVLFEDSSLFSEHPLIIIPTEDHYLALQTFSELSNRSLLSVSHFLLLHLSENQVLECHPTRQFF